jgi:hypothetical protein
MKRIIFGFIMAFVVLASFVYWDAWTEKEWITVRVEEHAVWELGAEKIGWVTINADILAVSLHRSYPSNKMNWMGFPKRYYGSWHLLKAYYNPPTDSEKLQKLKDEAWEWVDSEEGEKKIQEIKNE